MSTIWGTVKSWMGKNESPHWVMAALTLCVVILTIINIQISCQNQTAIEKELRAYLTIVNVQDSLPEIYDPDDKLWKVGLDSIKQVNWSIKNLGHPPAYNVRDSTYLIVIDSIHENPKLLSTERVTPTTIGAGLMLPQFTSFGPISKHGRRRIFLAGKITYEDIFEEEHFLHFCLEYIHTRKSFDIYRAKPEYTGEDR